MTETRIETKVTFSPSPHAGFIRIINKLRDRDENTYSTKMDHPANRGPRKYVLWAGVTTRNAWRYYCD